VQGNLGKNVESLRLPLDVTTTFVILANATSKATNRACLIGAEDSAWAGEAVVASKRAAWLAEILLCYIFVHLKPCQPGVKRTGLLDSAFRSGEFWFVFVSFRRSSNLSHAVFPMLDQDKGQYWPMTKQPPILPHL